MKLTIVDVFAERRYAGNQLAVVEDAGALDAATMQDIAREMNFSETTFVTAQQRGRAAVRIFTPEWELPFAGHPTLGTAWVLAAGAPQYTLDLEAGAVPVTFDGDMGWMTPPPARLGDPLAPDAAARLIGLAPERLDPAHPVRFAEVGPKFVLIGVADRAALGAARLDAALHRQYQADGLGVQCVFVFTADAHAPDGDYAARMFFESGGVREDPATGSANTAFAAYLFALRGAPGTAIVDQGVEMKRPSRLYLEFGDTVRVGGKVQLVATGELAG